MSSRPAVSMFGKFCKMNMSHVQNIEQFTENLWHLYYLIIIMKKIYTHPTYLTIKWLLCTKIWPIRKKLICIANHSDIISIYPSTSFCYKFSKIKQHEQHQLHRSQGKFNDNITNSVILLDCH